MSLQSRLASALQAIGNDIKSLTTSLASKVDKNGSRSDTDTGPQWRTNFTGDLDVEDANVAEHWINGVRTAGQNEWGAFRAWSAPYPDAGFRAIRTNSSQEGSGSSPAFHLNDRRTARDAVHVWARTWNGSLILNDVDCSPGTYIATSESDPNISKLPNGTVVVIPNP